MEYCFFSFKFYFVCLIILGLIFIFSWGPSAKVEVLVATEPLVMNLDINIDLAVTEVLPNLNTIPGKEVELKNFVSYYDCYFLKDLANNSNGTAIIFFRNDLIKLVENKAKNLLADSYGQNVSLDYKSLIIEKEKRLIALRPQNWKIEVLGKNFLAGQAKISLFLTEEAIRDYDFESFKQKIKFSKVDFVESELKKISSIRDVRIKIWPPFWKRMSLFPKRIKFSAQPLNKMP